MLSCSSFETFAIISRPEIAADDVAAERQRQAAGPLGPPLAEIDDLLQPFVLVGQLPLVDQQARVRLAVEDRLLNLVERDDDVFEVRLVDAQRQVRGRERAREWRSACPSPASDRPARGDDDRAVLVAHARAVRQQRVLVDEVRVGVKGHGRDLVACPRTPPGSASRCPRAPGRRRCRRCRRCRWPGHRT